jgi:hypothetical protein
MLSFDLISVGYCLQHFSPQKNTHVGGVGGEGSWGHSKQEERNKIQHHLGHFEVSFEDFVM